jgi:glycosyltransferase involved in cell wall biosynthesis
LDEEVKGCMFFADVVEAVRARGVRLSVRVVGNGPRRNELEQRLKRLDIECRFDGALQPEQMAEVYCSSKLLLFPSRGDAWGLVANEAVMCGTPVIGSPHAASSKMFLERFNVGIVRPLSVDDWAEAAITVLSSTQLSDSLRARRKEAIEWFDVGRSADALNRSFKLASASQ